MIPHLDYLLQTLLRNFLRSEPGGGGGMMPRIYTTPPLRGKLGHYICHQPFWYFVSCHSVSHSNNNRTHDFRLHLHHPFYFVFVITFHLTLYGLMTSKIWPQSNLIGHIYQIWCWVNRGNASLVKYMKYDSRDGQYQRDQSNISF